MTKEDLIVLCEESITNLEDISEKAYDAYFGSEDMPEGCKVEEGEVDSHWDEYVYVPNETTIKAMEEEATPEPPTGWVKPAW